MTSFSRREFVKKSTLTTVGLGIALKSQSQIKPDRYVEPLFKISLAQWSLNPLLFSGKMDNLDFAKGAREHGIEAIEYVNQFFMDKAKDWAYLREMKSRADGEGVRSLLIMCDREGSLGDTDAAKRKETVENHKKWVEAAKYLGCHSIRVNGYTKDWSESKQDFNETVSLVSDGLAQLCQFADSYDINVIIENHGGWSSDAKWLVAVMKKAGHSRAGTLPDFGNFGISGRGEDTVSYDSYKGVMELMPYAKGVSVKPTVFDDKGNRSDLDYERMMKIVLDSGFRGYSGIEHGPRGSEWEGIMEVKKRLIEARDNLSGMYGS
jgi:sugar phosphate isomerase/epimerase